MKIEDAIRRMMEIFAEEDPVGLIAMGAPRDEYCAEAHSLYWGRFLRNDLMWDEILKEVFDYYFNGRNWNRESATKALGRIITEGLLE